MSVTDQAFSQPAQAAQSTLGHVSLSMQLSFQVTLLPTLWTLWNTAVETHVLSVVGVTAIPSQDSMTAVCCGWRDQLGSLSP